VRSLIVTFIAVVTVWLQTTFAVSDASHDTSMWAVGRFLQRQPLPYPIVMPRGLSSSVCFQGGVHPGMRAAAEMKKAASQQSTTGGKGMMGVILPMYAVGIVVYLVYTLIKVSLLCCHLIIMLETIA